MLTIDLVLIGLTNNVMEMHGDNLRFQNFLLSHHCFQDNINHILFCQTVFGLLEKPCIQQFPLLSIHNFFLFMSWIR